jgi:hypothetical protein
MDHLYITWKDYENGPVGHLGLSWRSGRYKKTFTVLEKAKARAQVSKIESSGRRWGRVAVVNRSEASVTQPK